MSEEPKIVMCFCGFGIMPNGYDVISPDGRTLKYDVTKEEALAFIDNLQEEVKELKPEKDKGDENE